MDLTPEQKRPDLQPEKTEEESLTGEELKTEAFENEADDQPVCATSPPRFGSKLLLVFGLIGSFFVFAQFAYFLANQFDRVAVLRYIDLNIAPEMEKYSRNFRSASITAGRDFWRGSELGCRQLRRTLSFGLAAASNTKIVFSRLYGRANAGRQILAREARSVFKATSDNYRRAFSRAVTETENNLREANDALATLRARVLLAAALTDGATSSAEAGWSSEALDEAALAVFQPIALPIIVSAYENRTADWRYPVNIAILTVAETGSELAGEIKTAWTRFARGSDEEEKERLKREILAELRTQGFQTETVSSEEGVILVQASGSSSIDRVKIDKLQQSFSDRVIVNFDDNGRTGVIQPVFRDRAGEKYIFVLTPIKQ